MDKVYKIRHKPSGLFYQPTRGRWARDKSNLSERGKIYEIKPRKLNVKGRQNISEARHKKYGVGYPAPESYRRGEFIVETCEADWELVTYELKEGSVE